MVLTIERKKSYRKSSSPAMEKRWAKWNCDVYYGTVIHYPTHFGEFVESGYNFMDVMLQEIEESPEKLSLALTANDIVKAKREGKIAMLLGFEGGEPVGKNLANLRLFYKLGLRLLQLTWNQRNQICDGCAEPSDSGLQTLVLN